MLFPPALQATHFRLVLFLFVLSEFSVLPAALLREGCGLGGVLWRIFLPPQSPALPMDGGYAQDAPWRY